MRMAAELLVSFVYGSEFCGFMEEKENGFVMIDSSSGKIKEASLEAEEVEEEEQEEENVNVSF